SVMDRRVFCATAAAVVAVAPRSLLGLSERSTTMSTVNSDQGGSMSSQRKPSIVFVHGLWADGSCFGKLIPTLQKEGFEVIASQHGLDSHASDVTNVKRTIARVPGPVVLVGHS